MKKIATNFTAITMIVALILFGFLASIYVVSMDRGFYANEYEKNATNVVTKMSMEDLNYVTDNLLRYLSDDIDTLDMTAVIDGENREVFDEREKAHMIDVKDLFLLLRNIIVSLGAVAVFALICGIFLAKWDFLKKLSKSFFKTAVVFIIAVGALGGMVALNFNSFWISFHEIFFTNDLWQLDPDVSVMINMFPQNFFFTVCVRILIYFVVYMVLLSTLAVVKRVLDKRSLSKTA